MSVDLVCARCGAPLPPEAAGNAVTCAFCGTTAVPAPRVVERVVDRVVVVQATDGAQPSGVHCPRCGDALHDARHGEHLLRVCRACGGVWLEPATVEHLVTTTDADILGTVMRAQRVLMPTSGDRRAALTCPFCSKGMARSFFGEANYAIDACAAHGTFFERGELKAFAEHHRARRAGDIGDDDLAAAGLGGGWGWGKKS